MTPGALARFKYVSSHDQVFDRDGSRVYVRPGSVGLIISAKDDRGAWSVAALYRDPLLATRNAADFVAFPARHLILIDNKLVYILGFELEVVN